MNRTGVSTWDDRLDRLPAPFRFAKSQFCGISCTALHCHAVQTLVNLLTPRAQKPPAVQTMDFWARVPRLGAVAPDGDAPSTTGIDVWCAHPFIDRGLPLRNVLDTDAGLDKQQRSILSPEHDAINQGAYLATPALLRYKNITRGSMLPSLPPQLPVCAHRQGGCSDG